MVKPVGGRGKTAPYQTVHVRVPEPIKADVEKLIADYRNHVLSGDDSSKTGEELTEIQSAIKLVNRFIEEIGQTEHLYDKTRRNNINLAKFRDWLIAHSEGKD